MADKSQPSGDMSAHGTATDAEENRDVRQTSQAADVLPSGKHSWYMSCIVRKPDFCQCRNKGADQLRRNCKADQRFCFRFSGRTIPLLFKSEISSF